jgi:phenylacetate-CoA ligase
VQVPDFLPGAANALRNVISFCARHVPYYRDQNWAGRVRAGRPVNFLEIPYTLDSDVKKNPTAFYANFVPPEHGPVNDKFTSGFTGESLKVPKTALHFEINAQQNALLKQGWGAQGHKIVVSTDQASKEHPKGTVQVQDRGCRRKHVIRSFESREIAQLVASSRATLLASRPSVVHGTLLERELDLSSLGLVTTVGESLSPQFMNTLRQFPLLRHFDSYGAVETGVIAGKCSWCGVYHLASEHVLTQVTNSQAQPVREGEAGSIAVTPLFNYAMPLLKYRLGDIVETARADICPFGKGGFAHIIGRERHQFLLPNGSRITPNIATAVLLDLGVRQYRLVQTAVDRVELYYVTHQPDAVLTDEVVRNLISLNIAPGILGIGIKVAAIPPSASGKYLMHESRLQQAA